MIGTSDQSCWLAEACKILLLLLHCNVTMHVMEPAYEPNTPTQAHLTQMI